MRPNLSALSTLLGRAETAMPVSGVLVVCADTRLVCLDWCDAAGFKNELLAKYGKSAGKVGCAASVLPVCCQ